MVVLGEGVRPMVREKPGPMGETSAARVMGRSCGPTISSIEQTHTTCICILYTGRNYLSKPDRD